MRSVSDVKKSFDDLHAARNGDLKNISKQCESYLCCVAINNGLIESDIEERYNFKPIYAAASYLLQGIDLTSMQNFE